MKLLAPYGLKWNPFSPEPAAAISTRTRRVRASATFWAETLGLFFARPPAREKWPGDTNRAHVARPDERTCNTDVTARCARLTRRSPAGAISCHSGTDRQQNQQIRPMEPVIAAVPFS